MASTSKFVWSEEATMILIHCYRRLPIFYDDKHVDYENKAKREDALCFIRNALLKLDLCKNQCPTVDDIKWKLDSFNNLDVKARAAIRAGAVDGTPYTMSGLKILQNLCLESKWPSTSTSTSDNVAPNAEVEAENSSENERGALFSRIISDASTSGSYEQASKKQKIEECSTIVQNGGTSATSDSIYMSNVLKEFFTQNKKKSDIIKLTKLVEEELLNIKTAGILRKLKINIMQLVYEAQEEDEQV